MNKNNSWQCIVARFYIVHVAVTYFVVIAVRGNSRFIKLLNCFGVAYFELHATLSNHYPYCDDQECLL